MEKPASARFPISEDASQRTHTTVLPLHLTRPSTRRPLLPVPPSLLMRATPPCASSFSPCIPIVGLARFSLCGTTATALVDRQLAEQNAEEGVSRDNQSESTQHPTV